MRSCRAGTLLASGLAAEVGIGDVCSVEVGGVAGQGGGTLAGEVVAFDQAGITLMPFGPLDGVAAGARLWREPGMSELRPDPSWRGRVVDAMGAAARWRSILAPGPSSLRDQGCDRPGRGKARAWAEARSGGPRA